ncbi:NAD(P)-binding protein [Xylariaceae sp. FL0804]|nr:NAD(P)-binding protein [Xylariaceae sp. FL0804]
MAANFTIPQRKLTWLITGCSSGFGLSLARIVQAKGHGLVASSRDPARTPDLVAEVEGKGGQWIRLDVNDPDSGAVVQSLEQSGGQIDVLVNNAGYSIFTAVETSTEDEIRAQMETMYFGPLRLIKAALPHMRKRNFGVIANVSSGAAIEAYNSMGIYAGAKAGLDALTRVLDKEVSPFNIRALTLILGTFKTNMPNRAVIGAKPLPDAYKGHATDQFIQAIKSGKIPFSGDPDKAMQAVFELVTGEGIGAGKEAERFMMLGSDMITRLEGARDGYNHALEVFGSVAGSVALDK